jgi:prepilin-type N-terminal cleavage/methylation domain-containing protein
MNRTARKSIRFSANRRGFTLIEVLATLMLLALVLPALMQGLTLAGSLADQTRHRTDAAGLAESKLNEILSDNTWQQGNLSGDFGTDWPQYRWEETTTAWPQDTTGQGLQEIDVTVLWTSLGREHSVTVSSMDYVRAQQ